ncbi:hypothetical protein [Kitasatospora mediocidica]|uniref:hypothetical protein n=1 Tax=Kitasatospora mediocidica TaxID=58352 RepID=UPI000562AD44|nr:hypothetical protein [Kitasatospora mediocidica]
MSGFEELAPLYDVPATVTIRLVGGPFDGEERPFPGAYLSMVCPQFECALPFSGFSLADLSGPPQLVRRAVYQGLRNDWGLLSRDDQGRVRFDFWGLQ